VGVVACVRVGRVLERVGLYILVILELHRRFVAVLVGGDDPALLIEQPFH
jgi:hypothetical protein